MESLESRNLAACVSVVLNSFSHPTEFLLSDTSEFRTKVYVTGDGQGEPCRGVVAIDWGDETVDTYELPMIPTSDNPANYIWKGYKDHGDFEINVRFESVDGVVMELRRGVTIDNWGDHSCEGVTPEQAIDEYFRGRVSIENQQCVIDELGTDAGDANLDGVFDSGDLIQVFQHGRYESGYANWTQGDWNYDRVFDSSDLIAAFQAGGYENA